MAIRSSRGFAHLQPGAFHMFYKHTIDTTYIIESGRKKNKQARTWVSPKHKKGEVFWTLLAFCADENPRTATRNADSSFHAC